MALTHDQQKAIVNCIKEEKLTIEYLENTKWVNFCKTVVLPNVLVLKIHSLEALQAIVKKIYILNQQVKFEDRILCRVAAGGKKDERYSESFSLSPLVAADIVFNLIMASDDQAIEQVDATTVKIRPGPQIKALDQLLYRKYKLMTKCPASLIDRVTPFGLSSVGGHGTDRLHGGYADNIKSITFVQMDGGLRKIEKNKDPDFETIASTHLGLFGIVVEMELECKPAEKLECVQTIMSLPDFMDAIKNQTLPRPDYPMFSVFYVPTYDNDLTNRFNKNIKVYEYKYVPLNTPPSNHFSEEIEQWFEVTLEENLHIYDVLARFPQLVPAFMKYVVARFAINNESGVSVGDAPEIYHSRSEFPEHINDFDAMFAVSDNFNEVVDAVKKIAEETQTAKNRGEAPVTLGVYIRLIHNSHYQVSIAPGSHHSEKNYVCGLDVVSSPGAKGFEFFRDLLINYFIEKFLAKLHWGKYVPLDKGIDYVKMYREDLIKFKEVLIRWYNSQQLDMHRSPFLTEFFCKLLDLLDYLPTLTPKLFIEHKSCTLDGLCKLLHWIGRQEQQDIHTVELKKCVSEVQQQVEAITPSSSSQHFFQPAPEPEKPTRHCPRCCVVS